MQYPLSNLRIREISPLLAPREIKQCYPVTDMQCDKIIENRKTIAKIIRREDCRVLMIVGPCSIHDTQAGLEYAQRLAELQEKLPNLYIVMRVYFEKPRTQLGWRGLLVDPHLNGSNDFQHGIQEARKLLLRIAEVGIPVGSEFLDPIVPQYLDDLICWAAIGARTIESQTHRDMASGLSMPVGFKNSTYGNIRVAVDAVLSAGQRKSFLGVDQEGRIALFHTTGNDAGHLILRGGSDGPNYFRQHVEDAEALFRKYKLNPAIMIDCSHGNSRKKHKNQATVLRAFFLNRKEIGNILVGLMLESNLKEGRQDIVNGKHNLIYGMSVTDSCIGWDETVRLLQYAQEAAQQYECT